MKYLLIQEKKTPGCLMYLVVNVIVKKKCVKYILFSISENVTLSLKRFEMGIGPLLFVLMSALFEFKLITYFNLYYFRFYLLIRIHSDCSKFDLLCEFSFDRLRFYYRFLLFYFILFLRFYTFFGKKRF